MNTIARLADYIRTRISAGSSAPETPADSPQVAPAASSASPAAAASQTVSVEDAFPDPYSPIKRLITRTTEAGMPAGGDLDDLSGKKIIVSLDNHGFAAKVMELIRAKGAEIITIGSDEADVKMDLADVKGTEAMIEQFRKDYPVIDGFIHLAPLNYYFDGKNGKADGDEALNTTIKSCFVLLKGLFDLLDKKQTLLGTITFDSVIFPYMGDGGPIHPMFGGLTGLLKTANKELTDTRVKVVDFSYKQPKKSLKRICETFVSELLSDDNRVEVGYKNQKRHILTMAPSVANRNQPIVSQGDTMLVTGGAGGITYEICKKVVETYKVNLIILDINDIYSTKPELLEKSLDQGQLMALLKEDMPGVKPVEIKRALDRLNRVRQSVENIDYLKSLGVSVEYNCVDVTNYEAVKAVVDNYDRIDGIFHAAGMEMSQFIAKRNYGPLNWWWMSRSRECAICSTPLKAATTNTCLLSRR